MPQVVFADEGTDPFQVAADHYRHGRWQAAIEALDALLEDHPDHSKAALSRFFLGEALVQAGRLGEARQHLRRFLHENPESQYRRHALFRQAESDYLTGHFDDAQTNLELFRREYGTDELMAHVLPYLGDLALRDGGEHRVQDPREAHDERQGEHEVPRLQIGRASCRERV